MKQRIVGSIVLVLVTLGWGHSSMGESILVSPRELRVVDKHPLNWASITYNVFEHLISLDKDGKLVARLATSWRWLNARTLEVTLHQGVTFHNGEVFDAEIVKLNWDEQRRLEQPFRLGNFMNFKPESRLEIIRSIHRPVRIPGTGRWGIGQVDHHAYWQPPVLSRLW